MRKHLGTIASVLAIVAGSVAISWWIAPDAPPAPPLTACVTEDDPTDCYWDANRRGNQTGSSFVHWQGKYYLLDT